MQTYSAIQDVAVAPVSIPLVCPISEQSQLEERINTWTHGFGLVMSLVGFVVLGWKCAQVGQIAHILSCSVYATALVMVYAASTIYHKTPTGRWKQHFRTADHICIYFLIAGSYTPFAAFVLAPEDGLGLLWLMWAMTFVGTLCKLLAKQSHPVLSTSFYLLMGWCGMWVVSPLKLALSPVGYDLLVWGGVFYSAGTIFYVWKKLPFQHGIWHLFVLAGSTCHFLSIYFSF